MSRVSAFWCDRRYGAPRLFSCQTLGTREAMQLDIRPTRPATVRAPAGLGAVSSAARQQARMQCWCCRAIRPATTVAAPACR